MNIDKFLDALDDFVDFKIMLGEKGVENHWQYEQRAKIYERLTASLEERASDPPASPGTVGELPPGSVPGG